MPRKQNFRDRTTAEVLVGGKTTTMRGELMRHPAVVADLASRCTESCGDSSAGWCTIWYMITDSSVDIDAPASLVWDVFSDVERWPEWTASVTRLVALDGPGIAVGKRFEIKQPRMPKLVWEVTEVVPG